MIKGIVFDLYDTLIHLENEEYRRLEELFAAEVGVDYDTYRTTWRKYMPHRMKGDIKTLRDMVEVLLKDLKLPCNSRKLNKLEQMQINTLMSTIRFYHDVDNLLSSLKDRGLTLTLLSNTSHNSENVLEIIPWMHHFEHVVLSHKIGIIKPDPRIYLIALTNMGLEPNKCLFVGDGGSMELDGAANVGMVTAKVMQPGQNQTFSRSERADYFIDSIHEVPELVDRINNSR